VVDQELEGQWVARGRPEQEQGAVAAEMPEEVPEDVAEHSDDAEQVPRLPALGLPGDGHPGQDGDRAEDEQRVPDLRGHEHPDADVAVPLDRADGEVEECRDEDELRGDEGNRESLPVVHCRWVGRAVP